MALQHSGPIRLRLVALVAAVAIPLFGVLAWGFWAEVEREHRDARELALRIARSYASDLAAANTRSRELLDRMSERPRIRQASVNDCDSLFAIVDFFPQYLTLLLYDTSGALICASTPQSADASTAAAAERDVTAFLEAAPADTTEPLIRNYGERWVSIAFRPVEDGGTRTGLLALVQSFDIDVSSYPEATVLTVADSNGRVVARSVRAERWLGKSVYESELAKLAASDEGRVQARGVDGQLRQYGYTRVPGMEWHVFVGVPAGVAMAAVRSLLVRGVTAGAIVLVVVILLAVRLSSAIERPLEGLATAAERIGEEGYGVRVPGGGPQEIAVLADAFNRMVESRADAESALIESQGQLQALSKRLLDVQEEERTRIAREVHDQLGQALTALKMDVGGLLRDTPPQSPQQEAMVHRISRTLEDTLEAVQRISSELRPGTLDDFGLAAAIGSDVRAFEERTGIECEMSVPDSDPPLALHTQTAVYRIVQEAMTNVARHSNATRVEIRMRSRGDDLVLEIRDDGRGITQDQIEARNALGIAGMRERARLVGGVVDVEGVEGRGTIVSLRVPLAPGQRSLT